MAADKKREILLKLRDSKDLYVLMSYSTRAPFVACNPETYDDEVYLFFTEEGAKIELERLRQKMYPIQILKIDVRGRLGFYLNLYAMGVNCLMVDKQMDSEMTVQLSELVRRHLPGKETDDKTQIENPELHLTALYFMQELRKAQKPEMTDEMKAMYEEMMAHFQRGRFILAMKEDKQIPILKQKDEKKFLPVFTDIQEFGRFASTNKEEKLNPIIVESAKIPGFMTQGLDGIVLNPFGVNVPIQLTLKK